MGASNSIHKQQPRQSIKAQIERVWREMAADPQQQALVCSVLCVREAPYLAAWLKQKILAELPERKLLELTRPPVTDARILALNRLCEVTASPRPASINISQPGHPERKRAGRSTSPLTDFQASYQIIFGVIPETLPEVPPTIRVEPELGRAAIRLKLAAEFSPIRDRPRNHACRRRQRESYQEGPETVAEGLWPGIFAGALLQASESRRGHLLEPVMPRPLCAHSSACGGLYGEDGPVCV